MRLIAAAVVLAALAAAPATAGGRAQLQLVRAQPLTVQGSGFRTHERVAAVLRRPGGVWRQSARADGHGRFSLAFRGASIGRCTAFSVVTAGSKGSRATLLWRAPDCAEE